MVGADIKVPWQNSNEFCRFLGYLLAEGSISRTNNQIRFTNSSKEMINDFVTITRNVFDLEAKVYKYKENTYDVIINSTALRSILLKFGMSYGGAEEKYISDLIIKKQYK